MQMRSGRRGYWILTCLVAYWFVATVKNGQAKVDDLHLACFNVDDDIFRLIKK